MDFFLYSGNWTKKQFNGNLDSDIYLDMAENKI